MPKTIDWQDKKVKEALMEVYKIYTTSPKWGISYKIEKVFYEKTGKRMNYIILRRKIREIAGEE